MNKLCDGADFFRPEIDRIIRDELQEVPRFHRKQWEFAVIYRELERLGFLDGTKDGLSLGSGTERVLYAIARRSKHLWATDLYAEDAVWDVARTGDPTELVRQRAPFPFPEGAISARRMDMRRIDFPDASFDFAYSSCAIEHIGHRADFLLHLAEVRRVLRPGGAYVLTTELTLAEESAELPGNYFFSPAALEDLVKESGLAADPGFDATLTPHGVNLPLPVELSGGCNDCAGRLNERLFGSVSHLQLSAASTPFSSCVLVLRNTGERFGGFDFRNAEASKRFLQEGLGRVRQMVEESELLLHPFAELPDRRSQGFIGHAGFFQAPSGDPTLFHTAYMWLGERPRLLRVSLGMAGGRDFSVNVRVHRQSLTRHWGEVSLEAELTLRGEHGRARVELPVEPRADHRYAVLGKAEGGRGTLDEVSVTAAAAGSPRIWPQPLAEATPVSSTGLSQLISAAWALPPVRRALNRWRAP